VGCKRENARRFESRNARSSKRRVPASGPELRGYRLIRGPENRGAVRRNPATRAHPGTATGRASGLRRLAMAMVMGSDLPRSRRPARLPPCPQDRWWLRRRLSRARGQTVRLGSASVHSVSGWPEPPRSAGLAPMRHEPSRSADWWTRSPRRAARPPQLRRRRGRCPPAARRHPGREQPTCEADNGPGRDGERPGPALQGPLAAALAGAFQTSLIVDSTVRSTSEASEVGRSPQAEPSSDCSAALAFASRAPMVRSETPRASASSRLL
jgi:hypothetical protein